MAPQFDSHSVRRHHPRRLAGLSTLALGMLLLGMTGCYKNEENYKEEKYEQKKQEAEAEEEAEAEKDEKAPAEKAEVEESPVESSLAEFSKAVAEASEEGNGDFFKDNLIDRSIFEGCQATRESVPKPITGDELAKRFEETGRKAAIESFEDDLERIDSEKIIGVFTNMKKPAEYQGTIEPTSKEAACAIEASATVETATMLDHKDDDVARHITTLLYDGESWLVADHQSLRVDCDNKPMARTEACQKFQSMEM
jgi:hypothetical protein